MDDAKEKIEAFDWEGLEGRFWDRMEECRKVEEGVREEFGELVEVGWAFLLSLLLFGVFTRGFFRWEWGGFAWGFGLMGAGLQCVGHCWVGGRGGQSCEAVRSCFGPVHPQDICVG